MAYVFDKTDFIKIYPQFSSVGDDLFNFNLLFAQKIVNSYLPITETNDAFKIATYYTLAYLLSINTVQGGAGAVGITAGASEGSVSVSMSIPRLANTWWGKNNLGMTALLFLRAYAKGCYHVSGFTPEDVVDV